jgi:hypothetical protein
MLDYKNLTMEELKEEFLTSYLINNEINKRNQKNTVLTTYALRNKVIRYLLPDDISSSDED